MTGGNPQWIISCEHAKAVIPEAYRYLFKTDPEVLKTHRGLDIGALDIANALAGHFGVNLWAGQVTRLLVDLNRSWNHSQLWSEWSQCLSQREKDTILEEYYWPYWRGIESEVRQALEADQIVYHLSIHSFTPVLNGVRRAGEIGLLYDSRLEADKALVSDWQFRLKNYFPCWRIRRNYPYLGKADGLVTHLRKLFSGKAYMGIEIEINQDIINEKEKIIQGIIDIL